MWSCPSEIEASNLTIDELCEQATALFREVGDEAGVAASSSPALEVRRKPAICERIDDQAGIIRGL